MMFVLLPPCLMRALGLDLSCCFRCFNETLLVLQDKARDSGSYANHVKSRTGARGNE